MWFLCLLPLILDQTTLSKKHARVGCGLVVAWIAGQGLWLWSAYRLEFGGERVFRELWASSLVFLCVNSVILACFIVYRKRTRVVGVVMDKESKSGVRRSDRLKRE